MKTFATYVNCMEHIKSKHEKDTPYKCDECPYAASQKSELQYDDIKNLKCDMCGYASVYQKKGAWKYLILIEWSLASIVFALKEVIIGILE